MRQDRRWVKQRVEVNNADWTPIVPPLDFDYFGFRCDTSALVYRTAQDDESTEDTVSQYVQDGVIATMILRFYRPVGGILIRCRFKAGLPVCYVKSVSPTATAIVTWVL